MGRVPNIWVAHGSPKIILFYCRIFHYKTICFWGYHHFRKPPYDPILSLLVKKKIGLGRFWYTIYHHLPVATKGKHTPLLINQTNGKRTSMIWPSSFRAPVFYGDPQLHSKLWAKSHSSLRAPSAGRPTVERRFPSMKFINILWRVKMTERLWIVINQTLELIYIYIYINVGKTW